MLEIEGSRQTIEFTQSIGLDFGELDVLRDIGDGRLYIVDAANTPHSPADQYIGLGAASVA